MKQLILVTLTLLSLNLKAQSLVTCPLTFSVPKDSTTEVWGLVTSQVTQWQLIGNFSPNTNAKEGYSYNPWTPTNSQPEKPEGVLVTPLATQDRIDLLNGTLETQIYFCVYTKRTTQPNKK